MKNEVQFVINTVIISAIFILNYFYQYNGFNFTLKCICSVGFVLLGVINFCYVLFTKQCSLRFCIAMTLGLVFSMLGDVLLGVDFVIGAASFALGHICFITSYCFLQKMRRSDFVFGTIIFLCALMFLLFCSLLSFGSLAYKIVCIIYAGIISMMVGKAVGNFFRKRSILTVIIALASILFFFSDVMLVLGWFMGLGSWTSNACMSTYYPALCILALSIFINLSADSDEKCPGNIFIGG